MERVENCQYRGILLDVEQKKPDIQEYIFFHLYEVQEQAKSIMGGRDQVIAILYFQHFTKYFKFYFID